MRAKTALLLLMLVIAPLAIAEPLTPKGLPAFDQVLVNSKDWKDIYSGMLYAKLVGVHGDYVYSPQIATDVIASLPQDARRILLLSSNNQEMVKGLDRLLENAGFDVVKAPGSGTIGNRLASTIEPELIILIDERYPYNAVSVLPYALQQNGYVLFADVNTLQETKDTISDTPLLIYGIVDLQVRESLGSLDPDIINEGGKFDNNLAIVERFLQEEEVDQIVISNGEFIEEGLFDGRYPIIFVGTTRVPDQVKNFFIEHDLRYGIVVGNYLSGLMSRFKRTVADEYDHNLTLMVRFAKTPRVIEGQFGQPYALEYFPLPLIYPQLTIASISYNRLTKQLEVTYTNTGEITAYFLGSFIINSGDQSYTLGDEDPRSIVAGQEKTLLYNLSITPDGLSGQGYVIYGDYPKSLEYEFTQDFDDIPIIEVADDSELTIESILYDKVDKAFYITVNNPGEVGTYAHIELIDLIIDGVPTTIGTKDVFYLEPGERREIYIRAGQSRLDLLENGIVHARGVYGQREQIRYKTVEEDLSLKVRIIRSGYVIAGVAVIVILLLILFFFLGREKEYRCDRCGSLKRSRRRPGRHHCGGHYKK